ncbi:MAG: tetratricopeptide repeat protein [Bacteroidota bacterium]
MEDPIEFPDYQALQKANTLVSMGRKQEAADAFADLVGKGFDDAMLWANIARLYFELDDYEHSFQAAQAALEINPDNTRAMLCQVSIYVEEGYLTEAEQVVERCLELRPNDPNVLQYLIMVYLEQRRYQEAEKLLQTALEENPEHRGLLQQRIRLLAMRDELGKLNYELDEYLERDPTESYLIAMKAAVMADMSRYKDAEDLAMQSLAIDPQDQLAKTVLLIVYKNKNRLLRFFVGRAFSTYTIEFDWGMLFWIVIATKGVILWGGFFVLYMLITWVGGVLFNSIIRKHQRMSMLLTAKQLQQSNYFLANAALVALLSLGCYWTGHLWLAKALGFSILSLFIGISYFELEHKDKRFHFLVSSIFIGGLSILSLELELLFFFLTLTLLLILHGVLFTFRVIGE